MTITEPRFDYTDLSGKTRIVRKVRRYGSEASPMYIWDVEDILTKEIFKGVPGTSLTEQPPQD